MNLKKMQSSTQLLKKKSHSRFYHFRADKVEYRSGILRRLIYKEGNLTADILSDIQEYKQKSKTDFEVVEVTKKGVVYFT